MTTQTLSTEPLMRAALGEALRAFRVRAHLTLRELSDLATVSPGYLSEIERGRKEVSSELLAAVCQALKVPVSFVMLEAVGFMSGDSCTYTTNVAADAPSDADNSSRLMDETRTFGPAELALCAASLARSSHTRHESSSVESLDGTLPVLDDSTVDDPVQIPDTVPEHLIKAYRDELARRS